MPAQPPDFGKTWGNQNCYAYAIDNMGTGGVTNITPGQFNGSYQLDIKSATELDKAIVRDGGIQASPMNTPNLPNPGGKPGFYLIACKCSTGNYHFCRRDETTGKWWNKVPLSSPGTMGEDGQDFTPHTSSWMPARLRGTAADLPTWVGYYWIQDDGLPVRGNRQQKVQRCNCNIL